jgi:hypothetical protein
MEIQELLVRLSVLSSALAEIKMQKVQGGISPQEAKAASAREMKKHLGDEILKRAYREWAEKPEEISLDKLLGLEEEDS